MIFYYFDADFDPELVFMEHFCQKSALKLRRKIEQVLSLNCLIFNEQRMEQSIKTALVIHKPPCSTRVHSSTKHKLVIRAIIVYNLLWLCLQNID